MFAAGLDELVLAPVSCLDAMFHGRSHGTVGLEQIGRAAGRGKGEISVVAGSLKKKKNQYTITHHV